MVYGHSSRTKCKIVSTKWDNRFSLKVTNTFEIFAEENFYSMLNIHSGHACFSVLLKRHQRLTFSFSVFFKEIFFPIINDTNTFVPISDWTPRATTMANEETKQPTPAEETPREEKPEEPTPEVETSQPPTCNCSLQRLVEAKTTSTLLKVKKWLTVTPSPISITTLHPSE